MMHRAAVTDPDLLAFAQQVGAEGPVAVEGGRTRWNHGGSVTAGTRLVRAPAGIVACHPDEMIVQVRVGTTVSDLHGELAEVGQRTALPDRGGTVGGALAVGEDDVCVLGVGRIRTSLLQLRYVSADGRLITGGGPTVKNVSGFDLPRVMVGSLGTIGLFAEAILRTNPIPAVSMWMRSDDADPFAVRDRLFRYGALLYDGSSCWVQLEGHAPDVAALRHVVGGAGSFEEVEGPPDLPPHRWLMTRSELRTIDRSATGAYVASVGSGMVFAAHPQPARPADQTRQALEGRVKTVFDPTGRLNPGRDPAAT